MSFSEWSNQKKKKNNPTSSFSEWSNNKHGKTDEEEDIAPVKQTVTTEKEEKEDERTWFQPGVFEYDKETEKSISETILGRTKETALSKADQKSLSTYIPMLANKQYGKNNWSVLKEVQLVSSMKEGEAKEKRKKNLLKELKSVISDHNWNEWKQPLDDGWDAGDIASMLMVGAEKLFEGDSFNENDLYSLLTGEARDADFWDLTVNSARRGYTNSIYGEASFAAMNGEANEKAYYENKLKGREYQFVPDNWFEQAISGASELLGQQVRQWTNPDSLALGASAVGMAALAGNAGPQALVPEEIVTAPAAFFTGLQAGSAKQNLEIEAGLAYSEMLEAGVSEDTAKKIALAVGGANAALEFVQLDELAKAYKATKATGATKTFWGKVLDELVARGVDVAKETGQEVLQEGVTIAGVQTGSKIDTGEWAYSADEVGSRLGETAISSALSFGLMNAPAGARNIASITADHKTQNTLTANEQAVVDKIVQDKISEAKKSGKKADKSKIYNEVLHDMERGFISTEEIESVLGGDSYKAYKDTVERENALLEQQKALQDEYNALNKMAWRDMTGEQFDRRDELKTQLAELKTKIEETQKNSQRSQLKSKLGKEVFAMVKDGRLVESYNEHIRSTQDLNIDVTKYDGVARKTIENAIKSGANNSNRVRDFVELSAKAAKAVNTAVDFGDNKKVNAVLENQLVEQINELSQTPVESRTSAQVKELAELKEMLQKVKDGKITVNGVKTKDGILINTQSSKALDFILGHEVTHKLEKTEAYKELQKSLFDYAESLNDLQGRRGIAERLYKNIKGTTADQELTSDLAGEYLFSDYDFVKNFAVEHRNAFQKVLDQIKYWAKVATAGSKEARQLEKAKKLYEDALQELAKANAEQAQAKEANEFGDTDTQYSIREEAPPKKTIKGYKVFKVVDGKLYPPMVDNPSGNGTPVGVWLNADIGGLAHNKDGSVKLNTKGRFAVESSQGGSLAFRPGWHLGEYPDASQFGRMDTSHPLTDEELATYEGKTYTDKNGNVYPMNLFPYNFVWAECDVAADHDYQLDAMSLGVNAKGSFVRTQAGLPYVPTDGYYKYRTNADPNTAPWIISGAIKVNRILDDADVAEICAQHGVTPQTREGFTNLKIKDGGTRTPGNAIDLSNFGLARGDVTPTDANALAEISMADGVAKERSATAMGLLRTLPGYAKRKINFSDKKIIKEFAMNNQDVEYYRELAKSTNDGYLADDNLYSDDGVQYSISETDNAYLDAVNRGDTETAQKMVDEAAKKAGFPVRLFHGTKQFGFTRLKTEGVENGVKWSPFFATNKEDISASYVPYGKLRDISSSMDDDAIEEARETAIEEREENITDLVYDFRRLIDRHFSPWVFGQTDNSYLEGLVEKANPEPGNGDGVYDVLSDVVYDSFYDYQDEFGEYEDVDDWAENSPEGKEIFSKIVEIEGEKAALRHLEMGEELGGIYQLYANLDNMYVVDGKGVAWNELRPEGLPKIDRYGVKDVPYKTRDVAEWARENGFDGVIFKNIKDNGAYGRTPAGDVYAFFHPESQVKSADPITYDDSGNVIPLSQRFNAENDDIRHSLSEEGEDTAPVGNHLYGKDFGVKSTDDIAPYLVENEVTAPVGTNVGGNDDEVTEEHPSVANNYEALETDDIIKTVKDKLAAKITNSTEELEQTKLLRDWVSASYAKKITDVQAKYDSKKNKDTKVAVRLKNRIENLKRVSADLDADLAKRISDIEKRIANTQGRMQSPPKKDILEVRYERINNHLEADKADLAKEFEQKKVELQSAVADKDSYISNRANELYWELRNLKKGVRASDGLGYLLDHGFDWGDIKSALVNIKHTPSRTVNENSAVESVVREALNEDYDNRVYELDDIDNEYQRRVKDLEAEAEKERQRVRDEAQKQTRADVRNQKLAEVETALNSAGFSLDNMLDHPKRQLSTLETVDTMPQRVMEKTFGYKEGQALADVTVNKVAQDETRATKWLDAITNRKSGLLAQLSKQYHIKPGSKEVSAAQMYAEGFFVDKNNDLVAYGDAELAQDFPNAEVQKNIKDLAKDPRIRKFYDDTLDMMNKVLVRNGYPPVPRLDNYYLHFIADEGVLSKLGVPFNPNDAKAKDLPTDMVGQTADLKPGRPFFSSGMHREGKRTSFDLFGGMERYANMAKNVIFQTDNIQTLRAIQYHLCERFGQAHGLDDLGSLDPDTMAERIQQVYSGHLSTFASFLHTEANILAGKTSMIDRALSEGVLGRRVLTFLDSVNKQFGSAAVGGNVSSANTNWLPAVRELATSNPADSLKAFTQTVANILSGGKFDSFREDSSVYVRRKGADRFNRTLWQKMQDPGFALMGAVDSVSTELIARTEYNKAIREGKSPEQAHYEADKKTSRLMADRSLGQMPQMYTSRVMQLVLKFQLEVRNDLDSMFYDTLQEAKVSSEDIENNLARNAKTASQAAWKYATTAVALHMFGTAFESIAGYNPAFDVIEALIKAFGWDDDEESEDTIEDNLRQGAMSLLEDMPYANIFLDGGRIPVSNMFPDIKELVNGEDEYGREVTIGDAVLDIAPYLLPTGGSQIKKTWQGLGMFSDDHPVAGSYTDSGSLRFPVEDTFWNRTQAALFGQYANKNARDYFDNERSPLKEKQIQEYIDVDLPIRDYWEYREGLSEQETLEDKFDYIAGLDLPVAKKNILINNIVDRKEPVDMEGYEDFSGYEEFDFATKNPEKYEFFEANGVSFEEYQNADEDEKRFYSDAFEVAKKSPAKVTMAKAVSDSFVEFYRLTRTANSIKGVDLNGDGKTDSGSKKANVYDYIFSLDLDYGQKVILYRSMYDSKSDKATYNMDIVNYLNSRDDISYEEMVAILEELDFTVNGNNVSW